MVLLALLSGCASQPHEPTQDYRSRAISRVDGAVSVAVSVLSDAESQQLYGAALAARNMQPVWLRIENNDDAAYWFMPMGMDPNFFPPAEAGEAFANQYDSDRLEAIQQQFHSLALPNPIPPHTTAAGFVIASRDEGVKMVQVDLVASDRFKSFSILAEIPGFQSDYRARRVFTQQIYPADKIVDYNDDASFRAALEALPCCATNKGLSHNADPLNLVIVGGLEDAFPALVRRGWRPTEDTYIGSVLKMMQSALLNERYPYAPVSPLYLYGRPQDLALQKARDNVHQRNHLRLWLSPMRYHGKPVWVGQISRDIGTRLTIHSLYLTTHKIDPDVDEARTALQEDMAYSQFLVQLGLVQGVGAASQQQPRTNLTRDPYYTDGLRTVLVFDKQPVALDRITFLPWESPHGGFIEKALQGAQP